ncbi:reverse transcriptase domain-containing protein [Tanacetum coccineum]
MHTTCLISSTSSHHIITMTVIDEGRPEALLPLWTVGLDVTPESTLDMGLRFMGMRMLSLYREPDEIYTRLDDEQGQRQLLAGRVNMLFRDRRTHALTRQLMETEAGMSREAWRRAMDSSDLAHGGVISLRTTVYAQMEEITEFYNRRCRAERAMSVVLETDRRSGRRCESCLTGYTLQDAGTGGGLHGGSWPEEAVSQVAVLRLDSVMASCFVYSLLSITGLIPASKALGALTWWNTHVMTVTHDVAYSMTWVNLKKKMTDKYCVVSTKNVFQELALLCVRMFPEEADKIERGTGNANNNNNQKGTGSGQKPTCFECGAQGHFKKECPRLKRHKGNRGNQAGNDRAPAKVYVVGNAGANPDNVVAGTFLLNNRYAYILFDTGADRSFVSTAFSSQIDITPSTLDHYYDVELADGRIIGLNIILRVAH